ncbi:DUF3280 domain-containing protein [Roseobacter litoralis]|uniref:DUF2380 domain-containing protein n=1 Tax=Roseobacter litoralis (strain ATCC 49566 / DSM 6996 / JCM 21268 / NBRC 15278 / OCh 149) TaxID=391595 RepID=F7ZCA3_ROSLO|nr:DUF3280 domain-containing protein [Roseobacter litoralis]AEI95676.1 hypothetical protein RLO149_c037630 [Roseobacter litoralis Och 149]
MRLIILALLAATGAQAQEKVAFFGLTLLDTSLQMNTSDTNPDELARIATLEAMVADRFTQEGYVLVDIEPARDQIDRVANVAKCYGCDTRIATDLGADYALVGEVQKVSDLILAMNLQLRDADTGEMVKGGVVDIRGNTDDSWQRGMRYILKNRFFVAEE